MNEAIAGAAIGALVGGPTQVVVEKLVSKILETINMGLDYNDKLKQLEGSLNMVQKIIKNAEARPVRTEAVKEWLKQLEDVSFDADAVLDEVRYELLRYQVEDQNQDSYPVLEFLSSAAGDWRFKAKMSRNIQDVIKNLERINKVANDLGLHSHSAMAIASQMNTMRIEGRESESYSIEPNVEGRDGDVKTIVEMLTTAPPEAAKITVISIWGMGGIGKTTVAGTVFNHEKIENHFGKRIWLSVSINFDAESLFGLILQDLTEEAVTVTSKQVVLHKIEKILMEGKSKPYLLILDDVWNEDNDKWDDEFMVPLAKISNNLTNGNCIIVTTRNENVASHVKTLTTYQLIGLSETQCWSIIKEKAFKEKDISKEFEEIGIQIAGRCDGLPLAAKVIGSLLRGKSEGYWRSILEHKIFDGDGNKIMKILRLSYDNLPTLSLKKCFAYCSIFPQDYTIRRQEIVELWMAEEFLQVSQGVIWRRQVAKFSTVFCNTLYSKKQT